jgi:hypothetical protein
MKTFSIVVGSLLSLCLVGLATAGDSSNVSVPDSEISQNDSVKVAPDAEYVIAYYFHGDQRCATCYKLESYSLEALKTGFAEGLADSSLIWKTVNYDQKKNKHFIDDYKLYTKALILSRVRSGKEVAWKNLDQIWQLVGDKDKYLTYVQTETFKFLHPESEEE